MTDADEGEMAAELAVLQEEIGGALPAEQRQKLLKKVRTKDDAVNVFGRFFGICCGSAFGFVFLALFNAFPIASIIIGVIYKEDCLEEPMIPIYLIVGGVFTLLKSLMALAYRIIARKKGVDPADPSQLKPNAADGILNLFLFAWFIAGSYWTYHIFAPDPYQCNFVPYYFSFVSITIQYGLLGLSLLIFMCCCCCICFGACIASTGGSNSV